MEVDLNNLSVTYHDISDETNPLILHHKNTLVASDYPLYEQFTNLTKLETKLGLLDNMTMIRRFYGWKRCLAVNKVKIKGHEIVSS